MGCPCFLTYFNIDILIGVDMSRFLLNDERRKVLILKIHNAIYSKPLPVEFNDNVNEMYCLLIPYIERKYPQQHMQILAKYNTANELGIFMPNGIRYALHVNDENKSKYEFINYNLNGLLFPHSYVKEEGRIFNYHGKVINIANQLPRYISKTVFNVTVPSIKISNGEYKDFAKIFNAIRDINNNRDIEFDNYVRLILTAKTFDFLVEINPSFEQFREATFADKTIRVKEIASGKVKRTTVPNKCFINETHIKALIQNPITF